MRALIVALTLTTTNLLACPQLRGSYKECRSLKFGTISTDMTVAQSVSNKITTYNVSATNAQTNERESEVYKADGKIRTQTYTDPDSGVTLKTSTKISCTANVLNIMITLTLDGEPMEFSNVNVSKSGNQLFIESNNSEETDTEICE